MLYKRIFFILLNIYSTIFYSQNFSLDTSFGSNGTRIETSINNYPIQVYFENDNYYLINFTNSVLCLNYNGSKNNSFGNNGVLNFNIANQLYIVTGSKLHEGFIYVFGYIDTSNDDVFIVKISLNGLLDGNFGTNGVVIQDFGASDAVLNDILFLENNKIIGVGTKKDTSSKLFLTKYFTDGSVDFTFGENGFKLFDVTQSSDNFGVSLFNYQNGYLIAGKSNFFNSSTSVNQHELLLIKVDVNGEYIADFGSGGQKKVPFGETYSGEYSIVDFYLKNNDLFFSTYLGYSFSSQYKYFNKYNLDNEILNTVLFHLPFSFPYFIVDDNEKIYYTGTERCSPPTASNCSRDFKLYRRDFNGTLDTSFNSTGNFAHNFFPQDVISDDRSSVFYIHSDGKIFITGNVYNPYSTNGTGIGMVRISNSPLAIVETESFDFAVFPNPVKDMLDINYGNNDIIDNISIYTLLGEKIFNSNEKLDKINVSNFNKGIYFIRLISEEKEYTKRFIKL